LWEVLKLKEFWLPDSLGRDTSTLDHAKAGAQAQHSPIGRV
jgi:hypothetical protein